MPLSIWLSKGLGNRLFPLSCMARFFVLAEMIKNDIHKLKDLKGGRKNA